MNPFNEITWKPTVLGESVDYEDSYNPALLQAVPRTLNRTCLPIESEPLPFFGYDLWNLYELSWLTPTGKPINATAEILVAADSLYLIESKSLKLYLNSFNQTVFENEQMIHDTLVQDLSKIVQGSLTVVLNPKTIEKWMSLSGDCIDDVPITVDQYQFHPDYLRDSTDPNEIVQTSLVTHLFKSNCLVTGQPDWASLQISYKGAKWNSALLLKYLLSYRAYQGFHEHCVERIFMDLMHYCSPSQLTVAAFFTRRGGISITPIRSSQSKIINPGRLFRQ